MSKEKKETTNIQPITPNKEEIQKCLNKCNKKYGKTLKKLANS